MTPLDDLLVLLELETLEENLFRGVSPDEDRQRVFGGQVAAQSLVAAGRTVDAGRVHHGQGVGGEVLDSDLRRGVAAARAAVVEPDHPVMLGQGRDQRIPHGRGVAVPHDQQDRGAGAPFLPVDARAVVLGDGHASGLFSPPPYESNTITERAIAPVFISVKASLTSPSLIRREIMSSSFSLPDM